MTKKKTKAKKAVAKSKRTSTRPRKAPKGVKTLVSLVLDESGSMMDTLDATISGVNEYVGSLKAKGDMLFSLTKFNTYRTQIVQSGVPISEAAALDLKSYRPDGGTPLFDAVGRTINDLKRTAPAKAAILVAIVTDGQENQSKEFTREQVASLIREQEKAGWTFVYLGSNHDAWAAASSIGIRASNAVQYQKDNVKGAMRGLSTATVAYATKNEASRSAPEASAQFFTEADKQAIEGEPEKGA